LEARKLAEGRLALFTKISQLAETMELEGILPRVARLATEYIDDWAVIHTVEDGQILRGPVTHRDPSKVATIEQLLAEHPSLLHLPDEVLKGRAAFVRPGLPNAQCMVLIPFVVLGSMVAVGQFVTSEPKENVGPDELQVIEELSRRIIEVIEKARLQQELRQSERRFRLALEHARVAIFEEDSDWRIRFIYNPELGTLAEQMIGRRMHDKMAPDEAARLVALKREAIATGRGFRVEFNPEPEVHLIVHYEPLRDAAGNVTGFVGAAVNITDERKVQKELAEGLSFREQMMGVLGHDLRNPLGAVRGLSGLLLLQKELPEKAREALHQIDQAGRRMTEMIETLLDFTHSRNHGSLPVEKKPADLVQVTRRVVEELRASHPSQEIRLDAPPRLPGEWDPARMAQVVSNLVGNALTHGAADQPVEVSLKKGDAVTLIVSNRGKPIPKEVQACLFEPFRRGASHDGTRPRGLGLGLYIARQIVTEHGGTIGVESGSDATIFRVRLN
jgi:PAS domain S-box-containing protein